MNASPLRITALAGIVLAVPVPVVAQSDSVTVAVFVRVAAENVPDFS